MMTTASVSNFMMDAPGFNDQMELTSEHPDVPENADDFDIDLDLMQDQEPDNDVIVDDALPDTEDLVEGPGHTSDGQHDADMLDEDPTEVQHPSTNAPYEQYQEGYYQTDETYYDNGNNSYEAEMVDGFEEEMDSPPPDVDSAEVVANLLEGQSSEKVVPSTQAASENEDVLTQSVQASGTIDDAVIETNNISEEKNHGMQDQEKTLQQKSPSPHENPHTEPHSVTDPEHASTDHSEIPNIKSTTDSGEQTTAESQHQTTEDLDEAGNASHDQNEYVDSEQRYENEDEASEVVAEAPALPPIKVLYQDNEISLFPPREGDTSETFFLQDEGFANENLAELLGACREVLGEHIGEGEELTLDIDSLNLHLNEESPHTSNVTLYQIIGVYLQLCHNDGLEDQEPLYITLGTKNNFLTEFSNLIAAADDGKGLSSLQTGDDLEPGDTGEEYREENVQNVADESHPSLQPTESESVGHNGNETANLEEESQGEPQDTFEGEPEDRSEGNVPNNEAPQVVSEQNEHNQDYVQHPEFAADDQPQPTDTNSIEGAEEAPNEGDATHQETEQAVSGLSENNNEQVSDIANVPDEGRQAVHSEAQLDEEPEVAPDDNQTSTFVEETAVNAEDPAVEEVSAPSPSSETAANAELEAREPQNDEEAQEEFQDDDIDLGYPDESAGGNANIHEVNGQEGLQSNIERPASPQEDLFEFEDQEGYDSPSTLAQASTTHSVVGQEVNREPDASSINTKGGSLEEHVEASVSGARDLENIANDSTVHGNSVQDGNAVFDENGQYDDGTNSNKEVELQPVEVPSLESGECSPDPQRDNTESAVEEDAATFEVGEATENTGSSRDEEPESFDNSGLEVGEEMIAKTPDPLDGLYEIDEDLFKSPIKDLDNNKPPVNPIISDTAAEETSTPVVGSAYSNHDYDSDEINFDEDDAAEKPKESDGFGTSGDQGIAYDGSQSTKRSRDEGDEPVENITPDVKRHRSQ